MINKPNCTEITHLCQEAVFAVTPNGYTVTNQTWDVGVCAFEFRWTDGRLYKVVVSDAETVGVENMVYPPPAKEKDR